MTPAAPPSRQCVILVGGLGTRLGALTRETPKPLMPVGDRPFLDILIRNVARQGFGAILLLAGYRAERILERYGPDSALAGTLGINIDVVTEPAPAGTAGALVHAVNRLEPTFLMMNGDSLFDLDLQALINAPVEESWVATLALREVPDADRYGVVELVDGRIRSFLPRGPSGQPGLVNGGVYWMRRSVLDRIGSLPASLEQDVFPGLAAEGLLTGQRHDGYFLDIGIPDSLAEGQRVLPGWCAARGL